VVDFYFGKNSGNAARTALALYEVGVPFVAHPLDLRKPRSPEYLAVDPVGKVPALIDGAATLWESNAINWYLADKYQQAGLLRASPEGRADVLRWAFFQASHVSPAATAVHRALNPAHVRYLAQHTDAHEAENGRKELARYLPVLESALAHADWLGDYSLADIALCSAPWLPGAVRLRLSGHPRVRAWLERIRARPAWQKAHALIFDGYAR
jgi:glutathione S-transferase